MSAEPDSATPNPADERTMLQKRVDRRRARGMLFGGVAVGAQAMTACSPVTPMTDDEREVRLLAWREYIKGNYRS